MPKPIICRETTISLLKSHRYYPRIKGRSKMNKAELCKAINSLIEKKVAKKSKKKTPKSEIKKKSLSNTSKQSSKSKTKKKSPQKKKYPKKHSLTNMPTEIREKIMLDMTPKTLANACNTDKQALKICNDNQFWMKYFATRGQKIDPNLRTYTKKIEKAQETLMLGMDIKTLESECLNKSKLSKICRRTNFWDKYFNTPTMNFNRKSAINQMTQKNYHLFGKPKMSGNLYEIIRKEIYIKHHRSDILPGTYIIENDINKLNMEISISGPNAYKVQIFKARPQTGVSFVARTELFNKIFALLDEITIGSDYKSRTKIHY